MKKSTALKAACKKVFKQGEDPNIHNIFYHYKAFNNITEQEQEAIYNYIADYCGISREEQLTIEQHRLLKDNGFLE